MRPAVRQVLFGRRRAFSPLSIPGLAFWGAPEFAFQEVARTTPASLNNDPVGSWTDLSGTNHATQSTLGKRPLIKTNIINSRPALRFDGVDDDLALSGLTLGTQATIFVVTQKSSTASAFILGGSSSATPALLSNFAGNTLEWYGTDGADRSVISAADTGLHVFCIKQTDGVRLQCYVDRARTVNAVPTGAIAGRQLLHLGSSTGTLNHAGMDIVDFLVWPGVALTDVQQQSVEAYLIARNGGLRKAVFVGDSQTFGTGATAGNDYPAQVARLLTGGIWSHANLGVGGVTIAFHAGEVVTNLIADAAAVAAHYSASRSKNVLNVWAGINDSYYGASGAAAYGSLATYCRARQIEGWWVNVLTMLSRSDPGTPVGFNTERAAFNSAVRSNWATFGNALVDVAADSRIGTDGAELDTTYFSNDLVHMNATGYGIIAGLVAPAVLAA